MGNGIMSGEGKVAIVTGSGRGIGRGIALLFAEEGAKVALMARREEEGIKVEKSIREKGGDATYIQCDVSVTTSAIAAVAQTVETYGGIDISKNEVITQIPRHVFLQNKKKFLAAD